MKLRIATLEDYKVFDQMYQRFSCDIPNGKPMEPSEYRKYLTTESIYLAVNEQDEVIGYTILFAYEEGDAFIKLFYVSEKNKGIGTEFYRLIEKEIREFGLNEIRLHVLTEEPENFWYRNGFRSIGGTDEFVKHL